MVGPELLSIRRGIITLIDFFSIESDICKEERMAHIPRKHFELGESCPGGFNMKSKQACRGRYFELPEKSAYM